MSDGGDLIFGEDEGLQPPSPDSMAPQVTLAEVMEEIRKHQAKIDKLRAIVENMPVGDLPHGTEPAAAPMPDFPAPGPAAPAMPDLGVPAAAPMPDFPAPGPAAPPLPDLGVPAAPPLPDLGTPEPVAPSMPDLGAPVPPPMPAFPAPGPAAPAMPDLGVPTPPLPDLGTPEPVAPPMPDMGAQLHGPSPFSATPDFPAPGPVAPSIPDLGTPIPPSAPGSPVPGPGLAPMPDFPAPAGGSDVPVMPSSGSVFDSLPSDSGPAAQPPVPQPPAHAPAPALRGGPSSSPFKVQDILVAVAEQSGTKGAVELSNDTILGHVRSSTREKRENKRTSRKTRNKKGRPQLLHISTRFDPGRPLVITVASPKGGVGKSTTAANLAGYFARAAEASGLTDLRVLLVDGDIANGNLALRIAKTINPNLLNMINHMDEIHGRGLAMDNWDRDVGPFVLFHERIPNLDVLAAPVNPKVIEDLKTEDLDNLMKTFARFYQIIIFDAGTQITEFTNCAWLRFASQVYLMVEPELACLSSTADYAIRAKEQGLITNETVRLVCIRADMEDIGDLRPRDVVSELFSYIPPHKQFYIDDFHRDGIEAANAGEFLVLDSADYAAALTPIVQSALESYERDFGLS